MSCLAQRCSGWGCLPNTYILWSSSVLLWTRLEIASAKHNFLEANTDLLLCKSRRIKFTAIFWLDFRMLADFFFWQDLNCRYICSFKPCIHSIWSWLLFQDKQSGVKADDSENNGQRQVVNQVCIHVLSKLKYSHNFGTLGTLIHSVTKLW